MLCFVNKKILLSRENVSELGIKLNLFRDSELSLSTSSQPLAERSALRRSPRTNDEKQTKEDERDKRKKRM